MKNAWVYVVVIATLAAAGGYVAHLRLSPIPDLATGQSNKPTQLGRLREKTIDYAVDGPAGTPAALSYLDTDGTVQEVSAVLPWQGTLRTSKMALSTGIVAQSTADHLSCRITINGDIRNEKSARGPFAAVNCEVSVS